MECVVYWLRFENYVDPRQEGYIGVSVNFKNRLAAHKNNRDNIRVKEAANSGEMVAEILFEGTVEDCLKFEYDMRPGYNIGWNIIPGGGLPPKISEIDKEQKIAMKISETLKAKGANPYSEKTHSPEARQKRSMLAKQHQRRYYRDPETGKGRMFNTGIGEFPPESWLPGRVDKPIKKEAINKARNVKTWKVTKPDGETFIVTSLKTWCMENGVKYSTVIGQSKGWIVEKIK